MCFRKRANVHICRSSSSYFHAGIPVQRIPCWLLQNVQPSGSSSTPLLANWGGAGYSPSAIADSVDFPFADASQIAQCAA